MSVPFGISTFDNLNNLQKGYSPDRLYIIGEPHRPGVGIFGVKLEYTHYPPRSGKNYLLEMHFIRWPDMDLLWFVYSIPVGDMALAEKIAADHGLELTPAVPHVYEGGEFKHFPLEGPTVRTLRNVSTHPVYTNDRAVISKILADEKAECDRIIDADTELLRNELRAEGRTEAEIEEIIKSVF